MTAEYEIERKYLLTALPSMPAPRDVLEIDQGYLPGIKLIERLRKQRGRDGSVHYFRTVKLGTGVRRLELEDTTDAPIFEHLWQLTEGRRLRKRRYIIPENSGSRFWEIDEFLDRSLFLAEIEIEEPEAPIEIPGWLKPVIVREVTNERAYTNRNLAR